jgi:hypothetical protein
VLTVGFVCVATGSKIQVEENVEVFLDPSLEDSTTSVILQEVVDPSTFSGIPEEDPSTTSGTPPPPVDPSTNSDP